MLDATTMVGVVPDADRSAVVARGVVEALAYADIFDWPLTPREIHRNLPVMAEVAEVEAVLGSGRLSTLVGSVDHLYVLRGREHLVPGRRRRQVHSAALWVEAIRQGRRLSRLPWVRLVAVTGSLAAGAAHDDADIDVFVATVDGRLWLVRALTIGLARASVRKTAARAVLCPNYLLTTSALELHERDVFTAHELAQLVPLHGPDAYVELLRNNGWYRAFLPNHPGYTHAVRPLGTGGARRVIEPLLRNPLVGRFERWEMERKIARLACPDLSEEVRFSASTCKGHFDGHRERVLAAFEDRRRGLAAAAGEPRR